MKERRCANLRGQGSGVRDQALPPAPGKGIPGGVASLPSQSSASRQSGRPQGMGVPVTPAGDRRIRETRGRWLLVAGAALAVVFALVSCGVKAPPQPREVVVPAPVASLAVTTVPEGLRITFTLPSRSLDGSRLKGIGGYRILREGPQGTEVRGEVRFSVSEMRQMVGKKVTFLDKPPSQGGAYRYCAVPFDAYGSHASERRTAESCWEGFLSH